MNSTREDIKVTHALTNTSKSYLVVGNCSVVMSTHDTQVAAEQALASIGYLPYADAQVVEPGKAVSGSYLLPLPYEDPEPADVSSLFASE